MRLRSLHIKGYKNIQDLSIDFTNKDGVTLLIGNNGSGKSNIIEAIASIFAGLYANKVHKPDFEYEILYEINVYVVSITLHKGAYSIKVDGADMVKTEFQQKAKEYLPENVIACYSGESLRLFESYFRPYYNRYIDAIKTEDRIPVLPMMYVNKYNIEIALLTLFFCDWDVNEDVKRFCTETLNIKRLKKIVFHYNNKNVSSWPHNSVVLMIERMNAVDGVRDISADTYTCTSREELRRKLAYIDERMFFKYMYAATMPLKNKAIEKIEIEMEMNSGDVIRVEELSEGEKKYLLIKTILEIISTENSIILFDEPDAHIHVGRKAELKTQLEPYTNRETIITTHSPTLVVSFEQSHLEGLGRDEYGHTKSIAKDKAKLVSELTSDMWSAMDQNAFLASNKPITLLVEGKTDKVHIEEAFKHLKHNYPDLDFDVFAMNSSEHIREVLIGLSCSEIEWNKKFIGMFDHDKAGKSDIGNGFKANPSKAMIKQVKSGESEPSKTFFAFLLPKKPEFDEKSAFTIENCYEPEKYQAAFQQAMKDKEGHFEGLSIDKVADDLKNKAKTILADHAKTFEESDFDWFRNIFDIVKEIKSL